MWTGPFLYLWLSPDLLPLHDQHRDGDAEEPDQPDPDDQRGSPLVLRACRIRYRKPARKTRKPAT